MKSFKIKNEKRILQRKQRSISSLQCSLKKKLQLKCWFTNHNKWNVACALLSKFCIDITTNK